ncbi:multifunctional expression regulator [Equid alphaherpesvirus 3]|uniref:Multifunctional expression regulator n=1 Tax=Equid alphaherpesvirus 3 TaxID=80341 RepID=A0A077B991_9ALPH|nr:multifunctional expression regulator [Equid alphaherpesvirus 3]AIL02922.1 multifunctional expression regulator [Equid alphaherpesvirus 3]
MAVSSVSSCEYMDDEMSILGSDTEDDSVGADSPAVAASFDGPCGARALSGNGGPQTAAPAAPATAPAAAVRSEVVAPAAAPRERPRRRRNRKRPFGRGGNRRQRRDASAPGAGRERSSRDAASPPRHSGVSVRMRLGRRPAALISDPSAPARERDSGWCFKTRSHRASGVHRRLRGRGSREADSERPAADRINAAAAAAVAEVSRRVDGERIGDIFQRARVTLTTPVRNGGFRAETTSPWAAVLDFGSAPFNPEERRVTWETLTAHGENLYKLFEVRSHAAEAARALRDAVMRSESLLEALASADETLSWCKMLVSKGLAMRTRDPIIATTGALLANLRLKLGPFLRCHLASSGGPSLEELCDLPRLSDVSCVPTFMLVTLARIARAVESGAETVAPDDLGRGGRALDDYVPGACLAGTLDAIDAHQRRCKNPMCNLVSSYTTVPVYLHGKYFYCNHLF